MKNYYLAFFLCSLLIVTGRQALAEEDSLGTDELSREQLLQKSRLPENLRLPRGWRGFDFSTVDSPVWKEGRCTAVLTNMTYQQDRGYGWIPGPVPMVARLLEKGDALRCDYHTCQTEQDLDKLCTFQVDLPNGEYHLFVVAGLAPYNSKKQKIASIQINDSLILSFPFFNRKDGLLSAQSVHHRYGFAKVTDGKLQLEWIKGNYMIINGLFVWPAEQDVQGRAAALRIMEDYYVPLATEVKPGQIGEIPRDEESRKKLRLTGNRLEMITDKTGKVVVEEPAVLPSYWQDKAFVAFQRDYGRTVYPHSVPTDDDRMLPPYSATAAKGEYEPWQLAIHAFQDLPKLKLSVTPLKQKNGDAVIGSERIMVRQGRVSKVSFTTHIRPNLQYMQMFKPLVPMAAQDLAQKATRLYWITVHVPDNIPPGQYSGSAVAEYKGGKAVSMDLHLQVRPFTLRPPAGPPQGMYWWPDAYFIDAEKQLEAQVRDMAEHGLKTVVLYSSDGVPKVTFDGEKARFDYSRVDQILTLLKKYGFLGPIPVYSPDTSVEKALPEGMDLDSKIGRKALAELIRGMIERYHSYGFEVYFKPVDEPASKGPTFEAAWTRLKRIKKVVPECKTFCTVRIAQAQALDPWLDVRCYGGLGDGWVQAAGESGDLAWEYRGIYGRAINKRIRRIGGLANIRTGVRGKLYWTYVWPKSHPGFDLDSTQRETGAIVPSAEGPIPIVAYECLREGIDDLRYYATLQSLVEEHNDAAGRETLEKVLASLDDRGRPVLAKFDKWGQPIDEDVLSLNDLREEMAARIATLSR